MNEKFRMRLYAMTSVACVAWLAQSTMEAKGDGTLWTAPSIILLVCQVIAILYTGINAFLIWMRSDHDPDDDDGTGGDETEDSTEASPRDARTGSPSASPSAQSHESASSHESKE